MLFWNKICGLIAIFLFSGFFLRAQSNNTTKELSAKATSAPTIKFPLAHAINLEKQVIGSKLISIVPQNYYSQHFGIMCKKELQFEKTTKIPLRFRVGSLQQCNYLEGKK